MIDIDESDDQRSIVAPNLCLRFRWTGDRWSHAIEIGPGPSRTRLAESIEGDPARDDPTRVVSPTYQEIHLQRDGADVLVLLVGRSGPHHFSAAFRVQERLIGDQLYPQSLIRVDVADRCRAELNALACTYLVYPSAGLLLGATSSQVVWEPDFEGCYDVCLDASSLEGRAARLSLAEAASPAWMKAQIEAQILSGNATQRCEYWWSYTAVGAAANIQGTD